MKIVDDLKRDLNERTYDDVISEFITYFSAKNYYLATGQFGSVTYPGISDLDMFLLVDRNYLNQAYRDFLDWVDKERNRQYCFFHNPVIATTQTLPYLNYTHTLYDFRIIDKKGGITIDLECKIEALLNVIWTTFLIKVVNRLQHHMTEISARKNLLVLKNLHQSEINLGGRTHALQISNELREESLKSDNSKNVFEEISNTIANIFQLLDHIYDSETDDDQKVSFNISRGVRLVRSDRSYFNNGNININMSLFDHFVKTLFWNKIPDEVATYYHKVSECSNIETSQGVPPSSVTPFGYPFYKSSFINFFKSSIRRYLL